MWTWKRNQTILKRPSPPPPNRWWQSLLVFCALVLLIDRFSTYVSYIASASLIYLVAIAFLSCWAGLRAGVLGSVLLTVYAWVVFHYPISAYGKEHQKANQAVFWTFVFYGATALTAGIVQNKLRAFAINAFDAKEAVEAESERRRLAEADRWASEEILRIVVESSLDAIVGLNQRGEITVWNPNAERLFGWTSAEVLGKTAADILIPSRIQDAHRRELEEFFATGQGAALRKPLEVRAKTKTSDQLPVELYIVEHKTKDGYFFIAFIRDISERIRNAEAIKALNASLEERVKDRTAQLEAANSELTGFTYSVSHDLRAPLRAIVANARIISQEQAEILDEVNLERLDRLCANSLKMASLIESLLKFARMGQVALKMEEVDLSDMALRVGETLQIERPGVLDVETNMIVRADPELLEVVVRNLIENSWKYVAEGERPHVEVGSNGEAFYVRDQGIGFDMKYVDKVWQPFERLHREANYSGDGIGLANCRRIIEKHGGTIWADSKPGSGTTIYFRLL